MHEAFSMKIGKRIENWVEHLSVSQRKWPLGKNLREYFVGVFRHGVKQRRAVDLAAPCLKQTHQVRMRQDVVAASKRFELPRLWRQLQ